MGIPRLIVAGTASGVGKTTVTVALIRAFRQRGLKVATFKVGPDYLDPTFHGRANRARGYNLDGWMMTRSSVLATFQEACQDCDLAIVEGMMGLYDGLSPESDDASTAQLAHWLQAPLLLVTDAGGMARSIKALALGYCDLDPSLKWVGLIANRIGGRAHLDMLVQADPKIPVMGGFPRANEHLFAERHLGLEAADEANLSEASLDYWAAQAEEWCDLDGIYAMAAKAPALDGGSRQPLSEAGSRCRIAIARDRAFHFYYTHNLRALEAAGATLVPFSPLADKGLPADIQGVMIGGGYPEEEAAGLAANTSMRAALLDWAERGGLMYAECGGLMYLTQEIACCDGKTYPMVGVFKGRVVMSRRLQALGYVSAQTQRDTWLGPKGTTFRGHQFRYSTFEAPEGLVAAYTLQRASGQELGNAGYLQGQVVASYVHGHWAQSPEIPQAMVAACAALKG